MPFAFLFGLYVVLPRLFLFLYNKPRISRGVLSSVFLWMVDVGKSRIECDEFVLAESARKAFDTEALDVVST